MANEVDETWCESCGGPCQGTTPARAERSFWEQLASEEPSRGELEAEDARRARRDENCEAFDRFEDDREEVDGAE